jgi:hypothetical protein
MRKTKRVTRGEKKKCFQTFLFSFYREKPGEPTHVELEKQKVPFFLNLAQCKLNQNEFYPTIELCSMAIAIDPGLNKKSLASLSRMSLWCAMSNVGQYCVSVPPENPL